ncbi:hypothetical protein HMPREF1576_01377 [Gardnerella pickettii JCP7719]|uniref:Uncharacterized protein n=1 Tax=Gardnerella pickettii JCP7719 TaxID=1261061 RepID=S4GVI0_9BIFI|nr:hypothetical protein HMPREF1576_01377 [Gardnerella pickettii JCP7719]
MPIFVGIIWSLSPSVGRRARIMALFQRFNAFAFVCLHEEALERPAQRE